MRNQPSLHPMDELKDKLRGILKVIPKNSEIYYLDYPIHSNGGDLLILKGTEAFFKEHNIIVRKRYSILDFPKNISIPDNVLIVLHGGGNFGDLYLPHQQLREQVVRLFPKHRIVILPQTIYYKDERNYDKTASIFNQHPDVHVFVRDLKCYETAKEKFNACHVYLIPDMAHQLWPITLNNRTAGNTLYFLRTDIEANQSQSYIENKEGKKENLKDWNKVFNKLELKIIRLFQRLSNKLPVRWFWYKYTDYLIRKTIREFSKYESIQTSRLHGHILSCLLDKPNTLIDNSYGKNKSYYDAWTYQIENVRLLSEPVTSHEEAGPEVYKKTLAGV